MATSISLSRTSRPLSARPSASAVVLLTAAAALFGAAPGRADEGAPIVLTATQATYSIAIALTGDMPVEVRNVPPDGQRLDLEDYIERRMDRFAPVFSEAAAVVSLTNALPGDPLYRFARDANIRIVDIEAALPWSRTAPGVGLIDAPVTNVDWAGDPAAEEPATAPYFWLSISNAIRMGDIVAHDLRALFPASAETIARNLDRLKRSLLALRSGYQNRLIESGADTVFALTGDFVYLTNEMGLFVDGYFLKQDVRWTADDLANLTRHLKERGIGVVIHRWMPSDEIQAAVRAGGAELVVLDPADPGIVADGALAADGLQQILKSNLEAISAAFER